MLYKTTGMSVTLHDIIYSLFTHSKTMEVKKEDFYWKEFIKRNEKNIKQYQIW